MTRDYQHNIQFGLSVFPTDNNCGVAPGAPVPIGTGTNGAVAGYMASIDAEGLTPSDLALENAADIYADRPVNPAGRYVLFATDGAPSCTSDAASSTLAAISALADQGISTFVLGFGDPLGLPTGILDEAALAGGVPRPGGPPHYYEATDPIELATAFDTIAGGIFIPSCSYELASRPPDPELVTVTLDGEEVPRDLAQTVGWDYYPDEDTITFFGAHCDQIEGGEAREAHFVYGCPGPIVD
jgi:hypothetical protein